ncbi:RNA degradosome polyphosphate kinase [Micromonospora endophytica]|uniref:Polyphosphate kinase n=1 Tax=Micromonospora endophytica TaxID=515350 RepID=A0A2W2D9K9_9ACTN|nr:RNA degradosome polyphosphate kinase [Micromonospora endophytica]PZF97419.1 RNA degradosome polyphosphate kinase [Micromonospora endophytica]RIW45039.1 RNA degradosome polyphosphate kinase [Micromonospora endophytica]
MSTPRERPDRPAATDGPATGNGTRPRGAGGRFRAVRPAPDDVAGTDPAAASAGLDEVLDPATEPGLPEPPADAAAALSEPTDAAPPALPEDRFLNRELSWLDFNARVLALAEDPDTPLLERAKFLAIFASNLDEFYMVRVAGLKRRLSAGLPVRGGDGLPLRTQLALVAEKAATLVTRHAACFVDDVLPRLAAEGIQVLRWSDLGDAERERLRGYFRDQIFPVLTPLAVDPAHPFPYISGRSLNLAVSVRDPDGGPELFARVKVPNNVPRFVRVDRDQPGVRMLPVEDLIAVHLGQLFSGMSVVECHLFRVTRNAEVEVDEDRDEDLLQALERELARRRFGPPVRLEVAASISDHMLELLVRELDMDTQDVLRVRGLLDLSALWQLYGEADRPDLKDPPFVPATHPRLTEGEVPRSVFATLRDGDVLVHHPYHSFATSVQRFIEQAAADPNVLAIKQTLYRTSGDSPIVDALVEAAAAGKQVVVLVELKARFDEVANIGWARTLERAGCHVVYGLVGLKTHCKTALVVRQEGNQIRRYCHIGTGNYHPKTARLYEDFGMLTADPEIGADLTDLFNVLTGYSRQTAYRRLLVAPQGIRNGLVERIQREIAHVRLGMPGLVQFKVNALVDEEITDALYRASQAGVHVDLIVRGMCMLRPGVPGLSENIRVRSILGRFLEHSRIFRFGNSGDAEFWIGSADLMHRNLDRRVEALVQVSDPVARAELDQVLGAAMSPDVEAFELDADGHWTRRTGSPETPLAHVQDLLLRRVGGKTSGAVRA